MVINYSILWSKKENFEQYLSIFKNKDKINFLEIGVFEGASTNYFLENFLTGNNCFIFCVDPFMKYSESTDHTILRVDNYINADTFKKFCKNTSKHKKKVRLYKGFSRDILPQLENKFHFIYIDGDHSSSAVYDDAIKSFQLLLIDGVMIFDDYLWGLDRKLIFIFFGKEIINRIPKNTFERLLKKFKDTYSRIMNSSYYQKLPKAAIDKFILEYKDKIKILNIDGQVVIKKIKN